MAAMCLIAVAWQSHPRFELALIANRDEFHGRAAEPAQPWADAPRLYGGRDLEAGGAWLLASTAGRLAAVTNVRVGSSAAAPRSRGALVRGFTEGGASGAQFAATLAPIAPEFGRYNLLAWDGASLHFASNHPQAVDHAVAPGIHAMSNGAFDADWPKSGHATRALRGWLASPAAQRDTLELADLEPLLAALADTTPAPDAALPDTGVGLEMERWLSPPFVRGERYGTRCSTVVLAGEGALLFAERRFGPDARPLGDSFARLVLNP
jgi:uncharacterized protein with NRDE domain